MSEKKVISRTTLKPTVKYNTLKYKPSCTYWRTNALVFLIFITVIIIIAILGYLNQPSGDPWFWLAIYILFAFFASIIMVILIVSFILRLINREKKCDRHRSVMTATYVIYRKGSRPIFQISDKFPSLNDVMKGNITSALRQYEPPKGWPSNIAWKPKRHFGPFRRGSEFSEIQVTLGQGWLGSGTNLKITATTAWYHNKYYTGHLDANILSKYYPGGPGNLPANLTPQINPILFELQSIHYSSRYGGSIHLRFMLLEDYGYEFTDRPIPPPNGTIPATPTPVRKWDVGASIYREIGGGTRRNVGTLEMSLYIVPTPRCLNPLDTIDEGNLARDIRDVPIYVELLGRQFTTYEEGKLPVTTEKIPPELTSIFEELYPLIESQLRADSKRFVYAWLHSELQARIDKLDNVKTIMITDDFCDIITEKAQPIFSISMRFAMGVPNEIDTEYGEEELKLLYNVFYRYVGDYENTFITGGLMRLHEEEVSRWCKVGSFTMDELPNVQFFSIVTAILEEGNPFHTEGVEFHETVFEIDTEVVQAIAAAMAPLGLYDVPMEDVVHFITEDATYFELRIRAILQFR